MDEKLITLNPPLGACMEIKWLGNVRSIMQIEKLLDQFNLIVVKHSHGRQTQL